MHGLALNLIKKQCMLLGKYSGKIIIYCKELLIYSPKKFRHGKSIVYNSGYTDNWLAAWHVCFSCRRIYTYLIGDCCYSLFSKTFRRKIKCLAFKFLSTGRGNYYQGLYYYSAHSLLHKEIDASF